MPVDATPALPGVGDLVLFSETRMDFDGLEVMGEYRVKVATLEEARELKNRLWISHFATCPSASKYRRAKSKGDAPCGS